jgi:hypothetical protein
MGESLGVASHISSRTTDSDRIGQAILGQRSSAHSGTSEKTDPIGWRMARLGYEQ